MKRLAPSLAVILAALQASPVAAMPWITMGPRAMGMGGAQVAIAQGPLASYWNPGGLGQLYNTSGVEFFFGGRGDFTGTVIQGANDLYQVQQDCIAANAACTDGNIQHALGLLGNLGNGAMVDAGAGIDVKIGRMVIFANNTTFVGASPRIDLVNNTMATVASNTSKLLLRGGIFTDIGVGYGREIHETGLTLGANLKAIVGRVGVTEINIVTEDPGSGAFRRFKDNTATSVQPGLDLGALWDMRETLHFLPMRPRVGIVARNINNPGFTEPKNAASAGITKRYVFHGQTRAGVAISPLSFWNIAADIDLTENTTPIDGYLSRYFSLGTEINVFNRSWLNIPLRVGIQNNLSERDSRVSYTAGFGMNFVHVMFDIAGMISSESTVIQSQGENQKIPNNAAASARLAVLFGGGDEGARNK